MKNSKKILILVYSIFIISLISTLVGYSLHYIIDSPVWAGFVLTTIIQFFGWKIWERFVEFNQFKDRLDQLNSKEYRAYMFDLPCQHCSTMQPIEINLDNDEFICMHCGKENKVLVSFMTAAKIPDVDEKGILGRMQRIHDEFA